MNRYKKLFLLIAVCFARIMQANEITLRVENHTRYNLTVGEYSVKPEGTLTIVPEITFTKNGEKMVNTLKINTFPPSQTLTLEIMPETIEFFGMKPYIVKTIESSGMIPYIVTLIGPKDQKKSEKFTLKPTEDLLVTLDLKGNDFSESIITVYKTSLR